MYAGAGIHLWNELVFLEADCNVFISTPSGQEELIPKNHHITARSLKNHRFFLKLQKSTSIASVACNMH
jgi:hypothetical protein